MQRNLVVTGEQTQSDLNHKCPILVFVIKLVAVLFFMIGYSLKAKRRAKSVSYLIMSGNYYPVHHYEQMSVLSRPFGRLTAVWPGSRSGLLLTVSMAMRAPAPMRPTLKTVEVLGMDSNMVNFELELSNTYNSSRRDVFKQDPTSAVRQAEEPGMWLCLHTHSRGTRNMTVSPYTQQGNMEYDCLHTHSRGTWNMTVPIHKAELWNMTGSPYTKQGHGIYVGGETEESLREACW